MKFSLFLTFSLFFTMILAINQCVKKIRKRNTKLNYLPFFARMMEIADDAYEPSLINIKKWDIIKICNIESYDAHGLVVVNKKSNDIVVGFRGTYSFSNVETDLNAVKADWKYVCSGCKVHKGFLMYYKNMLNCMDLGLLAALKKKSSAKIKILVTGHSLGGAIANLYAGHIFQRWKDKYKGKVLLVTYGSPRVGNVAFANFINSKIGLDKIFRVVFKTDPVSLIPLKYMGYLHAGGKRSFKFSDSKTYQEINEDDYDSINPLNYLKLTNHIKYTKIKLAWRRLFLSLRGK